MLLLQCAACTASFYENQRSPDYAEPSLMAKGRVPFYLQQGAGISLVTRPLARLNNPPGSSYLDVCCGFGFGLDFAVSERGWIGQGIDSAPLAKLGRDILGLDIALRYLEPADAAGLERDVVMSSETIEHVRSPAEFVRTLRWAIKPGGILILTTPDADRLDPSVPPGTLVPMLSPGLHLVFQNRTSLKTLLLKCGFTQVRIEQDAYSIVAYPSDKPFALAEEASVLRGRYRSYLERRAASAPAGSELFFGMAGRALTEAMSDGFIPAAARAWELLAPACRARFGIDLDDPALPPGEAEGAPLERIAELMPLNLASILYARVMMWLAKGLPRSTVEPHLLAAVRAAQSLRGGLNDIAIDDVQTADIGWVSQSEAALCAAERGAPDIVDVLAQLPDAPGPHTGEQDSRRQRTAVRVLTTLLNTGRYDLARAVADAEGQQTAGWSNPNGTDTLLPSALCDGLFCLGVLDPQAPADPARALKRMRRVQDIVLAKEPRAASSALLLAALRGELQALYALGLTEEAGRLQARIAARARLQELVARQLTGLVNAARYIDAMTLVDEERLEQAWWATTDEAAPAPAHALRDALFSLAILNLQQPVDRARARASMRRVQTALEAEGPVSASSGLFQAALQGEAQACAAMGLSAEADRLRHRVQAPAPLQTRESE
jgi:SAM-dependent methyltransferase